MIKQLILSSALFVSALSFSGCEHIDSMFGEGTSTKLINKVYEVGKAAAISWINKELNDWRADDPEDAEFIDSLSIAINGSLQFSNADEAANEIEALLATLPENRRDEVRQLILTAIEKAAENPTQASSGEPNDFGGELYRQLAK